MGLDLVEIIMDVEVHFGISIPDKDAEKLKTPNHLIAYIEKQLKISDTTKGPCASQVAFYKIRNALVKEFGKKRDSILLGTLLEQLLPNDLKKQHLDKLLNDLGIYNGPNLNYRTEGKRLIIYPSIFFIIFVLIFLAGNYGVPGFILGLCISCLPGYLISKTTRIKTTINSPDYTVGNLAM